MLRDYGLAVSGLGLLGVQCCGSVAPQGLSVVRCFETGRWPCEGRLCLGCYSRLGGFLLVVQSSFAYEPLQRDSLQDPARAPDRTSVALIFRMDSNKQISSCSAQG
jgi:hypothetical protein